MSSDPWVTAIMPTNNRGQFVDEAIACFLAQSYQCKNLLILDDTPLVEEYAQIRERLRRYVDPRIEYTELNTIRSPYRIGRKRNIACSMACGEIIMHWDDDDYSAPGRMADQVEMLVSLPCSVVGYHSMQFTDGTRWWQYEGGPGRAIGTSLCYYRDYWKQHPFPDVGTGEDVAFVHNAQAYIATKPAGSMMFARNHSQNTSPRDNMHTAQWKELECA